jgi:hypothetical protein
LTIEYDSNVFHGGAVPIGNAIWRRNSFEKCRLIVDALPAEFVGNRISECQLEFLPNGVTPLQFAAWLQPRDPGLAAALQEGVAKSGWQPSTLH